MDIRRLPLYLIVFALTGALIANPLPCRSAVKQERGPAKINNDEKIVHVLNRLGYGPRPGDIERVRQMGLEKYIEQQLNPERIDDRAVEARLQGLESLKMSSAELVRSYPPPKVFKSNKSKKGENLALNDQEPAPDQAAKGRLRAGRRFDRVVLDPEAVKGQPREILLELSQQHLLRAVYSERQLSEVMADFWTNHFNVFWAKSADRYLLTSYEREVIRPNALGSFQKLLEATAQSPAMLFYLDNWLSVDPNAKDRIEAEKELKREQRLERLERRGPFGGGPFGRRPPFGTGPANIPANRPLPPDQPNQQAKGPKRTGLNENYARELMELHTMGVDGGYTQKDVTEVARCFTGWTIKRAGDQAEFFFNERFHDEGEKTVLGVKIPAGGGKRDGERVLDILLHHPSTAHFIATKLVRHFVSDNPPEDLVKRVATVFSKTSGDIRAMLRTIFASPEFYSRDSYQAKVKSPLVLVASALRAVDADTDASRQIFEALAKMGEPLFLCQPPTGYGDTADKWVNTSALVERLNFAVELCEGRIPGTTPRLLQSGSAPASLDRAIEVVLHQNAGETTRQAIEHEIGEQGFTQERLPKVAGLLLGSPEFQKM